MTSPWAEAARNGPQSSGNNQFVFDPNKPATSNSQSLQSNDVITNAAKGFSFGGSATQPPAGAGRPLLGSGNGPNGNNNNMPGGPGPQGQGYALGRGRGATVLFKPQVNSAGGQAENERSGQPSQQPAGNFQMSNWGDSLPATTQPSSNSRSSVEKQQQQQQSPLYEQLQQHQQQQLQQQHQSQTLANQLQQQQQSNQQPQGQETEDLKPDDASLIRKALHRKMGLIKTKADLEIIHNDPTSPLHSVKSFEELNLKPELLQGIHGMGFRYPSRIQENALPILLSENPRRNLIAQSQSGTGKTAAFVLTMLMRVDPDKKFPQALCIAPTYELALQIGAVTEEMGRYLDGVSVGYAVRGSAQGGADAGPITNQIIIGTPGTVMDWGLKLRKLDLQKLVCFVLDEADVMIGMQGHRDSSYRIKSYVFINFILQLL